MVKRTWTESNGDAQEGPGSGGSRAGDGDTDVPAAKATSTRRLSNRQSVGSLLPQDLPLPQISRKIKACAACRKHKIKCLMDESGPPCKRCSERNLGCVLSKSLQTIIDEKSQFSEAVVQDLEQMHGALKQVLNKVGLPELPPLLSSNTQEGLDGSPPKEDSSSNHAIPPPSYTELHGPSCDNSPKATPEDEGLPYVPIHSLYTLTKLSALRSPENPEAQRGPAIDDFIARGSLELADAEHLFALYKNNLDPYMYRIGCRYQTLDELRRKSPILSAATLTVAALHDPKADGLYGVCSDEFRRLMEKSMFDRRIDRDYLRAMCVASYWLSDLSWMLSGYAIRRAAECNLHNSYRQAIKSNNEEAADCARLWYILYICDQHLATLYGRPSIVQEDSSVQESEAFMTSPVATDEDQRLVGQVVLVSILRNVRELFGTDKGEAIPRVYLSHISQFRRQLDQWYNRWMGYLPDQWPGIASFPRKGTILHYNFAQIHLYSHVFRGLSGDDPIPHYFLDCAAMAISAATAIIDLFISDHDVGVGIVGMPSYMLCMTAFACMFLIKVTTKYGDDLIGRQRVHDLTTELVQRFRSLQAGKWHLANLMAGGLERMIGTLKALASGGAAAAAARAQQAANAGGAAMNAAGLPDGSGGFAHAGDAAGTAGEQALKELDGDLFFDYNMDFGLSPMYGFEGSVFTMDGTGQALQSYAEGEFGMPPA